MKSPPQNNHKIKKEIYEMEIHQKKKNKASGTNANANAKRNSETYFGGGGGIDLVGFEMVGLVSAPQLTQKRVVPTLLQLAQVL